MPRLEQGTRLFQTFSAPRGFLRAVTCAVLILLGLLGSASVARSSDFMLVPRDLKQTNHLKA